MGWRAETERLWEALHDLRNKTEPIACGNCERTFPAHMMFSTTIMIHNEEGFTERKSYCRKCIQLKEYDRRKQKGKQQNL